MARSISDTRDVNPRAGDGRDETELERDDRNLIELLQEARVVQTGVQILFGFLLTAPTSWHRILFRHGDKEHLVNVANRFMLAGVAAMGLTTVGVVMLLGDIAFSPAVTAIVTALTVAGCATVWGVLPLARRRTLKRRGARDRTGDRPLTRRPGAA